MNDLCQTCTATRDHPSFRYPTHLVHPEHHKPMVWSVRGEAMCRECGALWRFTVRNDVELVR